MKRKHYILLIWYVFIILGSFAPGNKLPNVTTFPNFDKIVHLGLYFILTILLVPIQLDKSKYLKSYLLAFVVSCCSGILFEIIQLIATKSRTASIADALANGVGAVLGIFFYQFLIREKRIEYIIFKIQ